MRYNQLTQDQRHQVSTRMKAGHTPSEISMILGRHKSTISREIHPNTGLGGYRPQPAQQLTKEPRPAQIQPPICHTAWPNVTKRLRQYWSPAQISWWLKTEIDVSISHGWIYQYVLSPG